MKGITLKNCRGIGDKIQFTSVPENYYLATGQKLVDVDRCWVFDYNPFVVRDVDADDVIDPAAVSMPILHFGRTTFTSLAERNALMFGLIPARLKHPRLYRFEDAASSGATVVHPCGVSQPSFSMDIVEHIRRVYPMTVQVGAKDDPLWFSVDGRSDNIWDAVTHIARGSIFIGCDSGLSWIAACYPRVWNKKVLMQFAPHQLDDYLPMRLHSPHTHWHDSNFTYYNRFRFDSGITYSYLKL